MNDQDFFNFCLRFLHLPYRWGGDDPSAGFDCSGVCIEILNSIGHHLPDMNAQSLYEHFKGDGKPLDGLGIGDLVFYGKSAKEITHVTIKIKGNLVLTASGGGSKTLTLQDAINQNAFIKIRPFNYRKDIVAIARPVV